MKLNFFIDEASLNAFLKQAKHLQQAPPPYLPETEQKQKIMWFSEIAPSSSTTAAFCSIRSTF